MDSDAARYLVNTYSAIEQRCRAAEMDLRRGGSHEVIAWLIEQDRTAKVHISRALDEWGDSVPAARWAKRAAGVGPVIAAGLAAHIDIARCNTVSSLWRFAGYDPHVRWTPGSPCPWNRDLKAICSMAGDSFSGSPTGFYGRRYLDRKRVEHEHNQAGRFGKQARDELGRAKRRDALWYERGQLPPEQIEARVKRWTVKLFLAHYHQVAWAAATGTEPPRPFVIAVLGREGFIPPPNPEEVGN